MFYTLKIGNFSSLNKLKINLNILQREKKTFEGHRWPLYLGVYTAVCHFPTILNPELKCACERSTHQEYRALGKKQTDHIHFSPSPNCINYFTKHTSATFVVFPLKNLNDASEYQVFHSLTNIGTETKDLPGDTLVLLKTYLYNVR